MATKSGFQQSISEASIQGTQKGFGSSPRVPQDASMGVQLAAAAAQLVPAALDMFSKSQIDGLQEDMTKELLSVSESRQQGGISNVQAETQYREIALRYKQNNPTYTQEINAISAQAIGRNPLIESEKAAADTTLKFEQLGLIMGGEVDENGDLRTTEDLVAIGVEHQKSIADAAKVAAAAKQNKAGLEKAEIVTKNTFTGAFTTAISARLNPLLADISTAAAMANSAEGSKAMSAALDRFDLMKNNMKANYLTSISQVLAADDRFSGLDHAKILDEMDKFATTNLATMDATLKSARDNDYLSDLTKMVKIYEQEVKEGFAVSSPLLHKAITTMGPDISKVIFTPELLRNSIPSMQKEILTSFATPSDVVADQSDAARKLTVSHAINLLGGRTKIDELETVDQKGAALKVFSDAYISIRNNNKTFVQTDKQGKQQFVGQEKAAGNAMEAIVGTAASINVTTLGNVQKITALVDSKWTDTLSKMTDQDRADAIADSTASTLHKEHRFIAAESGGRLEFDKVSGEYNVKTLTKADLGGDSQNMNRYNIAKREGASEEEAVYSGLGIRKAHFQKMADQLNENVNKQWSLRKWSTPMSNVKSKGEWAEIMAMTAHANAAIPFAKGQSQNTKLLSVLTPQQTAKQKRESDEFSNLLKKINRGLTREEVAVSTDRVVKHVDPNSFQGIPGERPIIKFGAPSRGGR